jgi:tetratricopeptide (TPR) repeat protein
MFKGKEVSIPTVATQLGVNTALEGSVRKAGDPVRITTQLFDVATDCQSPIFLAQTYASLGRRHEEMKARLSSLDLIQRHLEMNPHDTRALYVGANQLCSVGELDKGLELAERALGQDEKEPVVLYNVACF